VLAVAVEQHHFLRRDGSGGQRVRQTQAAQNAHGMGQYVDAYAQRPEFGHGLHHLHLQTLGVQCQSGGQSSDAAAYDENLHAQLQTRNEQVPLHWLRWRAVLRNFSWYFENRNNLAMNLDTAMLRAFVTLAEELHFGRTAEQLHITPTKLTRLIQRLEQETGAALVSRTTHATSLTTEGARLLPSARRIVAENDWLVRQTLAVRSGSAGVLVIGGSAGVLYEDLPGRIRAARKRFPEIVYQLVEVSENLLPLRVADGSVQVGFTYFPSSDDLLSARIVSSRAQ